MKIRMWIIGVVLYFNAIVLTAQPCVFSTGTFAAGGSYSGTCGLTVGGNITITGAVTWTSGTLQILGSAGNITIANGGSLTITAGGVEAIDDGPDADATHDGRVIVNSGGTLIVGSGASISSYTFMTVNGLMQIDGACTLENGRLDIGSTGQLYLGVTGQLNANGTGDNIIAGLVSIAGRFVTNGDIDVAGGTLEVVNDGEIEAISPTVDIEVYNGGGVVIGEGGIVHIGGSLINTDTDGCPGSTCTTPGGTFDVSGELFVAGSVTINNTTPNSSFTSSNHTGEIIVTGAFNDNECSSYDADDYHYCACSGQTNTTCDAALPIELISFSGMQIGNLIQLQWVTASETENDFFSVERLTDADSFFEVGKIAGAGTSSIEASYQLIDHEAEPGRNYYRLKQTDFDKTATYSSLIAVDYEWREKELTVSPNPCAAGIVFIHGKNLTPCKDVLVIVKDNRGVHYSSVTSQTDAEGNLHLELNVSSLSAGMYVIQAGNLFSKVVISK